ncbi:MAG TPA: hypothetical protein VM820_21500 [Vicinamibacterales bacterium]|nr:hypothetical protein [Vicinamibacterales bacterium]
MNDSLGGPDPSTLGSKILGALALTAVLWSVYEGVTLSRHGGALAVAAAPRRMVSLQLAPTTAAARKIVDAWKSDDCQAKPDTCLTAVAKDALARDTRFIVAYVTAWVLVALWATVAAGVLWWVTALIAAAIVLGGIFDLAENWLLGLALGNADALPFARVARLVPGLLDHVTADAPRYEHAFRLARLAAMSKFVLLLLGIAFATMTAGGGLRLLAIQRRLQKARAGAAEVPAELPDQPVASFSDLLRHETDGIFKHQPHRTQDAPVCTNHKAADEPFVSFREADIIGLALSGGGIRSATFNLGLLQGLHGMGLLRLVDYVSTVSGGGYIGAFWSSWLTRLDEPPGTAGWNKKLFPTPRADSARPATLVESDQERHLREFSGFLAPRWGFFEVETWTAIVSLLAGLVPALLIGLAVIGLTLIAWLSLTFPLASQRSDAAPALVIGIVTILVLALFEDMWQQFRRETAGYASARTPAEIEASNRGRRRHLTFAALAVGIVVVLQYALPYVYALSPEGTWPIFRRVFPRYWWPAPDDSGLVRWWAITGIDNPGRPWIFSPRLFDYGIVWLLSGFLLLLARTISALAPRPWRRESLAAFDRVLMRVLGMSAAWVGVATLWHIAMNLTSLVGVAVSAAISGGVFAALRNWIGLSLRRPAEASWTDRLKPHLPAVLAYVTVVLTAVTVGGGLIALAGADWLAWWLASAVMVTLLVLAVFITPEEFGLHAFYRERICRAYPGATNLSAGQGAMDNRGTEPRDGDDLPLTELRERPLHLVCCAANDLSGDQVETLNRGARSAVLSRHGMSLGRFARDWGSYSPGNRLGAAITASAAAFNSNMGHISVRVGPAVSFLMTMLNLRLGLWVRHPLAARVGPRRWPGLLYYREMLGLTSASGRIPPKDVPKTIMRDVHLSDGGHFENLAFYELVRRHCRYIIVSDCGADPGVAFDDLGNALRRIREDFGVDISLDVSPLRPDASGISRQHVAVGTINYSPTDVGILLYVKPSVTGDEPPDVQQYQTRNSEFPHEATTDQFYDEAQWESYRRLGLHAANRIFHFVAREDDEGEKSADWLFAEASQLWGETPEGLQDRVLEMTRRFGALEAELQQRQAQGLFKDVFPEMRYIPDAIKDQYARAGSGSGGPAPAAVDADTAMASELSMLLRVTQLMEDVWLACQLDRWWAHPLNLGWINLFARWATSPPFRFWWPVLAPMFSPGFRQFIQQRFPLREDINDLMGAIADPHKGWIEQIAQPRHSGLAALWWEQRSAQPARWDVMVAAPFGRRFYQNLLTLRRAGDSVRIQVGLATVTTHEQSVGWTSDDFFVPPSLWGAGIGSHFLNNLLLELSGGAAWCYVIVKAPPKGQAHHVARDDRQAFVEQYKKIGFRDARPDSKSGVPALCQVLGYEAAKDTLFVLDLKQWARRS